MTLSETGAGPTLTIAFPAPFALTMSGVVNLATRSVTFGNVPDVPLTGLMLTLTGPNGQKAFNVVSCAPTNLTGTFTDQGGSTTTSSAAIKFVNCMGKPTASGSLSGLAVGNPKLHFKVTHGKAAPNIESVAIGLPSGLKFARSAIVSRQTCLTKNGKKKCTTTTLIRGLGVSGAKVKSVALKGGKLVITLNKAAGSPTFKLSGAVLAESKSLQTRVKKHKVKKKLTVTLNRHRRQAHLDVGATQAERTLGLDRRAMRPGLPGTVSAAVGLRRSRGSVAGCERAGVAGRQCAVLRAAAPSNAGSPRSGASPRAPA